MSDRDGANALSLNSLAEGAKGWRLAFVVRNGMAACIAELAIVFAVFADEDRRDRLLRLNFAMPFEGRARVRQFDLDGTDCDAVGNVLVNDVASCPGTVLTPLSCLRALWARTDTSVAFGL